jgi:hypothetical protein
VSLKVLDHLPYNPDLHCDIFGFLKKALKRRRYGCDDAEVFKWFEQKSSDFVEGSHRLMGQWDPYLNAYGTVLTACAFSPRTVLQGFPF